MPEPQRAQTKPAIKCRERGCFSKQKAVSGTHRLDRVARKVALPRVVWVNARCQNTRSPAKKAPAKASSPRCLLSGSGWVPGRLRLPQAAKGIKIDSARAT